MKARLAASLALATLGLPASALAQGTALFSNEPGAANNNVPGLGVALLPGTDVDDVFPSPPVFSLTATHSAVLLGLDTADPAVNASNDRVLLVDGAPLVREGDAAFANPLETVEAIGTGRVGLNDNGEVFVRLDQTGLSNTDEQVVFFDSIGMGTLVAVESDVAPAPIGVWGGEMTSTNLTDGGLLGFESFEPGGLEALAQGPIGMLTALIDDSGMFPPIGVADAWENFDDDGFVISPDGMTTLVRGDTDGPTSVDDILTLAGVVIVQEGVALGAFPGDNVAEIGLPSAAGNQAIVDGANGSGTIWVQRNGTIVARTGDALPGAPDTIADVGAGNFFAAIGNLAGQYVFGAPTDAPDPEADAVLVLDDGIGNRRIVAREGDPVDLDGNGAFDDDAYIGEFTEDRVALSFNDVRFVCSVENNEHDATHAALVSVPTDSLLARFRFTPRTGIAPLTVGFADESSSPIGPIASWAWDFDGDGTVDSTAQNPALQSYSTPGNFTISLTVSDGANTRTLTIVDAITVQSAPGPTGNDMSPEILQYQFNEVRGDRVANSAAISTFPGAGIVNKNDWQGGPGRPRFGPVLEPSAGMLAFDPAAPAFVDTGEIVDIQGSYSILWWQRVHVSGTGGGYVFGADDTTKLRCIDSNDRWSLRGAAGTGGLTFDTVTPINNPIAQDGVWNHVALVMDDATSTATWYINGAFDASSGLVRPVNEMSTTNLFVNSLGNSSADSFGTLGDLDDFRIYARALTQAEVMAAMNSEIPVSTNYGTGCSPAGGAVPSLLGNTAPVLGGAGFDIVASGFAPGAQVTVFLNPFTSVDPSGTLPALPFDLGTVLPGLFTGCSLEIGISGASRPLGVLPSGTGSTSFVFPALPPLAGLHIYAQAVGLSGAGAQLSPALDVHLEN